MSHRLIFAPLVFSVLIAVAVPSVTSAAPVPADTYTVNIVGGNLHVGAAALPMDYPFAVAALGTIDLNGTDPASFRLPVAGRSLQPVSAQTAFGDVTVTETFTQDVTGTVTRSTGETTARVRVRGRPLGHPGAERLQRRRRRLVGECSRRAPRRCGRQLREGKARARQHGDHAARYDAPARGHSAAAAGHRRHPAADHRRHNRDCPQWSRDGAQEPQSSARESWKSCRPRPAGRSARHHLRSRSGAPSV